MEPDKGIRMMTNEIMDVPHKTGSMKSPVWCRKHLLNFLQNIFTRDHPQVPRTTDTCMARLGRIVSVAVFVTRFPYLQPARNNTESKKKLAV